MKTYSLTKSGKMQAVKCGEYVKAEEAKELLDALISAAGPINNAMRKQKGEHVLNWPNFELIYHRINEVVEKYWTITNEPC